MDLRREALEILKETSRTFYIPISRLPSGLQEAVASAYLCMRAIDEIEDHPDLDNHTKAELLQTISFSLQAMVDGFAVNDLSVALSRHPSPLPEVTIRIGEWALLGSEAIAPRIWDATAAMADRMAYDGTSTNRTHAIGFGRGLQVVNILRNRREDLTRGVDFFPDGWGKEDMQMYARRNLSLADAYTKALPSGPALDFCQIPLTLAYATLNVMALGEPKLSRSAVMGLIEQVTGRNK